MNEYVRLGLSEKKKIKDLFLVVIRSIEAKENRRLLSSLIQFVSNLCYGNGKFRTMLRTENTNEFFGTLKQVLQSTDAEETDKQKNNDRLVLKQSILAFLGNLCGDPQLRASIASNIQDIMDEVFNQFTKNVEEKKLMWQEVAIRELAVLINVSVEQ